MSNARAATGFRKDPNWNFRAVGAFVPKATAKACEQHGFHAAEIILNWSAIVGPQLAAYTAPRRIRWPKAPERVGGEPKVGTPIGRGVKSALEIWVEGGRAHEIPYLKAPIIARINTYFGYRAITDILPIAGTVTSEPPPKPLLRATPAELQTVKKTIPLPNDDALADALARLGAAMKKRNAQKR
jgi:hypothetical protein